MGGHHRYRARDHSAHHRRHIVKRNPAIVTETVFFDPGVTGVIIGFSTREPQPLPTQEEEQRPRPTQAPVKTTSARVDPTTKSTSDEIAPTSRSTTTSPSASPSIYAASSTTAKHSSVALPTASLEATSDEATTTGMSAGATAGLAAAGVAILIVVALIALIFYRRKSIQKKHEAYGNIEDEKAAAAGDAGGADIAYGAPLPIVAVSQCEEKTRAPSITSKRAPRVSLRPVTQFMPNLMSGAAATGTTTATGAGTLDVPVASAPSTTTSVTDASIGGALGAAADAGAVAAAAGAISAGGAVVAANQQADQPQQAQKTHLVRTLSRKAPPTALVLNNAPMPQTENANGVSPLLPPGEQRTSSPPSSVFTASSVGASPFAGTPGAPPSTGGNALNGPVHRVQMAFAPTMGDELELHEGQLVRIIHEYDDGWALCIRLDRSQQGVCPRTCLSQNPLKARPPPGPRGPPPRSGPGYPGPGPQQGPGPHGFPSPGGRNSPAHSNSPPLAGRQSPRPQSPVVRPHSPVVSRPQSPARAAGYHKPQYVPASTSRPQSPASSVPSSPTTPTIVISQSFSRSSSPSNQSPTSPTVAPRPAVAPIHPSPLSIQTSTSDVAGAPQQPVSSAPVFHAM